MNRPILPVIELAGHPRVRGQIHGEALRGVIARAIGAWQERISGFLSRPFPWYVAKLLADTRFKGAILQWAPDLLEEIKGIADGVGIGEDVIFAWQLADEHGWFAQSIINAPQFERNGCSALGCIAPESSLALFAQNWDIPAVKDGVQTLLHIRYPDSDLETLVLTQAGMVGALGMNNRGTGVLVNSLASLGNSTEGLPVSCLVRSILEKQSYEESVRFASSVRHATGQNYIICRKGSFIDLECSGARIERFSLPSPDIIAHTNNPFANTDRYAGGPVVDEGNSINRFTHLMGGIESGRGRWSVDTIRAILKSPIVCLERDNPRGVFTAGSVIMDLGGQPSMHVALGPPSTTPYHSYRLQSACSRGP